MYATPPLKDCHHVSVRPSVTSVRPIRPSARPICPSSPPPLSARPIPGAKAGLRSTASAVAISFALAPALRCCCSSSLLRCSALASLCCAASLVHRFALLCSVVVLLCCALLLRCLALASLCCSFAVALAQLCCGPPSQLSSQLANVARGRSVYGPESGLIVLRGGSPGVPFPPLIPCETHVFVDPAEQIRTTMKIQTQMQQGVPSYPAESIPASRQRTTARKLIGNSPKAERILDES